MTKEGYVEALLDGIEATSEQGIVTRLILSIDRRHSLEEQLDTIDLAAKYSKKGVVGIDVCGDPRAGSWSQIEKALSVARTHGLKSTNHL